MINLCNVYVLWYKLIIMSVRIIFVCMHMHLILTFSWLNPWRNKYGWNPNTKVAFTLHKAYICAPY